MKIGYVRVSPRFPAKAQREALVAAGVDPERIFEEGKEETRKDAIRAVRKGDQMVVDGLHRLGSSRRDLLEALEAIWKKGALVTDARTSRTADAGSAALVVEAIQVLAGEARMPTSEVAARRGKLGGGRPKDAKLNRNEMREIWTDTSIETNAEAAAICGVSERTLYRYFGSSNRPAGWPKRKRNDG